MKHQKGYTFIELLAVLSIIGIITSFSFPSFYNLIENQKAVSMSYQIFHYLNLARTEAISKNLTVTICASKDEKTCSKGKDWSRKSLIIFNDKNRNGKREDKENILDTRNFNLEEGSLIWRSFQNKNYLQWLPTGMTNYQNGNITYCPASKNAKHAKNIIMNAVGRMYFGLDRNHDGIPEGSNGKNISC